VAIPTITSVSPAAGPAGGRNIVTITGTGFQLPFAVATSGDPVPQPPSVRVRIDGIPALQTAVESATRIRVLMPAYGRTGEDAALDPLPEVAIEIANLTTGGAVIGAELVTAAGAYRYERVKVRPPAATEETQIFQQVIREVVNLWTRQLVPNVAIGTNVDFGDRGEIIVKQARLPNVTLVGPRITEDLESRHWWGDYAQRSLGGDPEQFELRYPGWLATFEFDALLASDKRMELYGMAQGAVELFMRTPFVRIPIVFGDLTGPQHDFPLHLTAGPSIELQDPNSNLVVATCTFEVKRVPFRLTEAVERGHETETGFLQAQQTPGATVEEVPIWPVPIV
jgi:hypothetical protein